MKPNKSRGALALAVVLVLYILIAFTLPFAHTTTFWVSFVFTLISFGVAVMSMGIAFGKSQDTRSRFYGCPIAKIGIIYSAAQLIAGLAVMALASYISPRIAILFFALALSAAILGLISTEASVNQIQAQDSKLKKNVSLMRSLQSTVNRLALQTDDPSIRALAEELRYSDPVSSESLAAIEQELTFVIGGLEAAVSDEHMEAARQMCHKASELLAQRNHLCKLNK